LWGVPCRNSTRKSTIIIKSHRPIIILFVWIAPIGAQIFLPQKVNLPLVEVLEEEQDYLLQGENREAQDSLLEDAKQKSEQAAEDQEEGLSNESDSDEQGGEVSARSVVVESKNLYQMLQTPSAWIMLWTTTILVGGGTVETNNMGQMVESLRFSPVVTSASLALFSVAQAASRVATGALSDSALNWSTRNCWIDNGVPRPFFLVIASLVGVLAHTILAISTNEATFVFGVALSGAAFGKLRSLYTAVLVYSTIFRTL
jgi:hypothetical protein